MTSESLVTVGLIALMVVGFYFLLLRPTRNRQKAQVQTIESTVPGVWVMTTTGMIGQVTRVGERQIMVEVSPGNEITLVKQAILQVLEGDQRSEFVENADSVEDQDAADNEAAALAGEDSPSPVLADDPSAQSDLGSNLGTDTGGDKPVGR